MQVDPNPPAIETTLRELVSPINEVAGSEDEAFAVLVMVAVPNPQPSRVVVRTRSTGERSHE